MSYLVIIAQTLLKVSILSVSGFLLLGFLADWKTYRSNQEEGREFLNEERSFWLVIALLAVPVVNVWVMTLFFTFVREGWYYNGYAIGVRSHVYDVELKGPVTSRRMEVACCPHCGRTTPEGLSIQDNGDSISIVCNACGFCTHGMSSVEVALSVWDTVSSIRTGYDTAWGCESIPEKFRLWIEMLSKKPVRLRTLVFQNHCKINPMAQEYFNLDA